MLVANKIKCKQDQVHRLVVTNSTLLQPTFTTLVSCMRFFVNQVHRSNMSKACLSSEEAEQTQAHYKKVYGVDSLVQVGTGSDEYRYFVFRASDGKVLKCVNYSPANLEPIVAEAAAVWQPNGATTTKQQARDENDDDSSSDDDDSSDDSDEAPRSLELVASFHRFFGAPVVAKPSIPPLARTNLRIALITEEAKELKQASDVQSIVDIADALCDLQYVLSGTVLEFGFGSTFGGVFADYLSDPEFISKVLPLL